MGYRRWGKRSVDSFPQSEPTPGYMRYWNKKSIWNMALFHEMAESCK